VSFVLAFDATTIIQEAQVLSSVVYQCFTQFFNLFKETRVIEKRVMMEALITDKSEIVVFCVEKQL